MDCLVLAYLAIRYAATIAGGHYGRSNSLDHGAERAHLPGESRAALDPSDCGRSALFARDRAQVLAPRARPRSQALAPAAPRAWRHRHSLALCTPEPCPR